MQGSPWIYWVVSVFFSPFHPYFESGLPYGIKACDWDGHHRPSLPAQVEVVLGGGVSLGVFCGFSASKYPLVCLCISSLICVWFVCGSL